MKVSLRGACILGAALLVALPAYADIVITTSGGRITGKIIEESDSQIRIKTDKGPVITIPREEVDSIQKEKLEDVFAKRAKKLKDDDAKGWLELGNWARDNRLPKEAASCWEKVIKLEPENGDARVSLGYTKVDGKWLKGDELKKMQGLVEHEGKWVSRDDKAMLDAGLVKRGERWVSKEDAEAIDAGRPPVSAPGPVAAPLKPTKPEKPEPSDEEPRAEPKKPSKPEAPPKPEKPAPPIELPADEKELLKLISTGKPEEKRVAAVKELCAKGETQTQAVAQELTRLLEAEKKKLLDTFKSRKGDIRGKMAGIIVERRKAAWAFIFDKSKYPDEDHGRVGQPEVDRLVDLLRRAWQDPLRELKADKSEKKVQDTLDEINRLGQWLREFAGGSFNPVSTEEELAKECDRIITSSKVGVDGPDLQLLEASNQILKYNETVKTSLTQEERDCVLATNEYRMMFGLKALKVYEPLIQAARKHSQDMVDHNFFAHDSPTKGSPAQRCVREGAKYSGENIAMGSTSGRHTFHQWYTSSGHHRNILSRHRSIGVGNSSNYWTQDFGVDDPS